MEQPLIPATLIPPGEFLLDILNDRGWSQLDFAEIIGRAPKTVNEIIKGKTAITPTTAKEIAAATDTNAMFWLNLDAAYRLHNDQEQPSPRIARHARLRQKFSAVREMARRGWISNSSDPAALEAQVLKYYDIPDLDTTPKLYRHAAKRTGYPDSISGAQLAWLFRVRQIAEAMIVRPYSERLLREAVETLLALRVSAEEIRRVPQILADCGVRLVIVEPMPGSKIDGVTFWPDGKMPVIGLSLRLDRIDNFWFVLAHEIEHVLNKHGREEAIVDSRLGETPPEQNISEEEQIANDAAAEFCVPQIEMNDFIRRNRPLFSEEKVVGFARAMQVHPGIVVGQLQRKLDDERRDKGGEGPSPYRLFRKHQVSVRPVVAPVAMTDGYGQVIPLSL
jgi:HTH-type transcriptional regulator / antitoxin HigA